MDYNEVVRDIESQHCGACRFGLAIKALRELQSDQAIVARAIRVTRRLPAAVKPHKTRKAKSERKRDFEKECNSCHVVKPLPAFEENKLCADGHVGTCRACRAEQARKRRLEKRAAAAKKQPNPEVPVTKHGTPATPVTVEKLPKGRFYCEPCHCTFTSKETFEGHNCLGK